MKQIVTCLFAIALATWVSACSVPPSSTETTTEATTEATSEATTVAEPTEEAAEVATAAPAAAGTAAIEVVDGSGAPLSFETAPERVICLYHTCMEYLAALGVQPIAAPEWAHVYQFAENPLYFPQPNDIVPLKMTENGPDLEQVAELQPDLVFGWAELREGLTGIAPLYDSGALSSTYQGALDELRNFAVLFGKEEVAEEAIKTFEDRLAAYKELSPRDLSVMNVGGDGKDFYITASTSVPCSLFNEVTICEWVDPAPVPGIWSYQGNIETVLALNPDVLIFESWTDQSSAELSAALAESNPLWGELSAVKNDRVYDDKGRASYGIGPIGGTRMLDTFMPLLYPEVFPAPLTDEEVQEILAQ